MELTNEQVAALTPDEQVAYAEYLVETKAVAEKLERHFSGLQASVDLINSLIASNDKSDETLDRVTRNYKHIEIVLAQDYIANDSRDKTVFLDAVVAAKSMLKNN
jgi:flagellar biosynthesis regulator FlaF